MTASAGSVVLGAGAGALSTGVIGYVVWHVRRPIERRETIIQKKMSDRWDASLSLRRPLRELRHDCFHLNRRDIQYVDDGRRHRKEARELARAAIPLLGETVHDAVIKYTDICEVVFTRAEAGDGFADLEGPLEASWRAAQSTIDAELKSLPAQ